jgi:hypothetical protein
MLWVEVLNRSLSWCDFDTAARLAAAAGGQLTAAAQARLVADAALLWRLFAAYHLQRQPAAEEHRAVLQWVEAVTLQLAPAGAGTAASPVLKGTRRQGALAEPFESSLTGALLQLLETAGEPHVFGAVQRCHGVHRCDGNMLLSHDVEAQFARLGDLEGLCTRLGLAQCPQLLVSARGRRFCSKSCSNATFAARKALEDPQYFAAKQERYRQRQRAGDTSPRRGEGAFVYMD